jgi:hypothetical protein
MNHRVLGVVAWAVLLVLSPVLHAAEAWTGTLSRDVSASKMLTAITAAPPAAGVVTIPVRTCDYKGTFYEAALGDYDYEESRYCQIPMPRGAVIQKITAFTWNDPTAIFYLDEVRTQSEFRLVTVQAQTDGPVPVLAPESYADCGRGAAEPFLLSQRSRVLHCTGAPAADENTAHYLRILTKGKAQPDQKDGLRSLQDTLFPVVRLLKVEYEVPR